MSDLSCLTALFVSSLLINVEITISWWNSTNNVLNQTKIFWEVAVRAPSPTTFGNRFYNKYISVPHPHCCDFSYRVFDLDLVMQGSHRSLLFVNLFVCLCKLFLRFDGSSFRFFDVIPQHCYFSANLDTKKQIVPTHTTQTVVQLTCSICCDMTLGATWDRRYQGKIRAIPAWMKAR